jgi:hydroxyacylglutathione hydrolase
VLITGFPAAAFGTNCFVVAPEPGAECVVVDPGIGVVDQLDELLAEHRLKPVAVLLTHGHIDHTFSVTPVCGARHVPAYLHPDDHDMLRDPMTGISPETAAMFGGRLEWTEPDDVRPLVDGARLQLAGLELTVDHAPGHTRGSVLFRLPEGAHGDDLPEVCLSGDVLFAGSIGRTDLPGGDHDAMLRSLATKILPLRDEVVVLPGHGPQTTIGRERATNPFLQELGSVLIDGPAAARAPRRGL